MQTERHQQDKTPRSAGQHGVAQLNAIARSLTGSNAAEQAEALHVAPPADREQLARLPDSTLFDNDTAARYLDLKPGTLETWRFAKRYDLPYIKIGRKVRYRKADLDGFLNSRTVETVDASVKAGK